MGRLLVLSGKEVCDIPQCHRLSEVQRRGSYIVMQRQSPERSVTVVVPDHREVAVGTLLSIIRQSGVPHSPFEA